MRRLGYNARFVDGPIVVEDVVCEKQPASTSACKVLQIGDRITKFDGTDVEHVSDLAPLMKGRSAGTSVSLSVVPDGETKSVTRNVTLIASPDDATRVIIGFIPADTRSVELPFEVSINTVDIGGPSAGLAFTLALLDELSPGELLGKTPVAATGTIDETGAVGAIGALTQKAVAVRDAGAKVFLVPSGQSAQEIAAAQKAAGSGVRIIPVATLNEALTVLEKLGGNPLNVSVSSEN
jgi:PDZ domain-containing protein